MKKTYPFSIKSWADMVIIIYIAGIIGLIVWALFTSDDDFWIIILFIGFLLWIAYQTGREKGRKHDIIQAGTEIEDIARVLSTVYLYKKNNVFPNENDVMIEMHRRERWLGTILKKHTGEKAFIEAKSKMYNDPPEDFK